MEYIVTIFDNILDTRDPMHVDVLEAMKRIRDGESKVLIDNIRNEKKVENQQLYKKRLPCICFSGRFSQRSNDHLLEHSGIMCLDIDGVKKADMQKVREALEGESFTYSCFVSPRGAGYKVLVKVNKSPKTHKAQFLALEKYYNELISPYVIDKSGKDVARVCYESYDPNIYYNEESDEFNEVLEEQGVQANSADTSDIFKGLRDWIDKQEVYVEGNRNNYLTKFAYALCRYGVPKEAVGYYYSSEFPDYPRNEIDAMLRSVYAKGDFGTETFVKQNFQKDVKNLKLTGNDSVTAFWDINDKGRVKIDTKKFLEFVEANGFGIFRPKESLKDWVFVRVENKIVDQVDVVDIKRTVLAFVDEHAPKPVFDELQMRNRFFDSTFLNALKEVDVQQIKDKDNESYIFFKDCFYVITKKDYTKKSYTSLGGKHIWRKQVCKQNITEIVDFKDHPFAKFVFRAITNNDTSKKDQYFAACSALGYAIHTYKKQRLTKLIYSCDESLGELMGNAAGGTGKNLFQKCLKYVRSVVEIDGKDFDKRDKFKFQTVATDTQIVLLDDYEGDIKELFSKITGNFEVERKGQDKVSIDFEDAPKLLVSSNSSPKGYSSSYQRRLHMMEFSPYYNERRTPASEFGDRDFFSDDWNQNDWNSLYSFLFWCVRLYLEKGLIRNESVVVKNKMLVKNTSYEFAEWITQYCSFNLNDRNNGRQMYQEFMSRKEDVREVSHREFYNMLKSTCEIYGWEFEKKGKGENCYIKFVNYSGFDNEKI